MVWARVTYLLNASTLNPDVHLLTLNPAGIYVAIKNKVDVEKVLVDFHLLKGAPSPLNPK